MALIVETGAVVANADSYVTLAAYQAYGAARGWTLGADDAADEVNLRRGYDTLNRNWTYIGYEVDVIDQTGAFPRYISTGRYETEIPADSIPKDVQDAQCELAYLIQGGADPFATYEGAVARAKAGPVEVEYVGGKTKPRFTAVEGLLRRYLEVGAGQANMVRG